MAKVKRNHKIDDDFGSFDNDVFGDDGLDAAFADTEKSSGKRSPFKRLGGRFVGGVGEGFMNKENQRKIIRGSLPKGYPELYDTADATVMDVKDLYDTARKGIGSVTNEVKRGLPSAINALPLSGKMKARALAWAKSGQNSGFNQIDPDEAAIALAEGDIFGGYKRRPASGNSGGDQSPFSSTKDTSSIMSDIADKIQTRNMIQQLISIKSGINRLAEYQDQVTINYQRKSLEISMRHYHVSRKSLDILNQNLELNKASYDKIITNTALPDVVKMQNSELAFQMLKQNTFGKIMDSVGGPMGAIRAKIMTKAKKQMTTFFKDVGVSVSDTLMGMSGLGEDGAPDLMSMVPGIAGNMAAGKGSKLLAKYLKGKFKDNDKLNAIGQAFANLSANSPEMFQQLISEDTGIDWFEGIKSTGFFDEFGLKKSNLIRSDSTAQMDKLAMWDQQSKKTLEEVIPGYLKMIHAETNAIRTGAKELSPMEYSWKTGLFESSAKVRKDIEESIVGKGALREPAVAAAEMLKVADPDNILSKASKRALTAYFVARARSGEPMEWAKISAGEVVFSRDPNVNLEVKNIIIKNILGGRVFEGNTGSFVEKAKWTATPDARMQKGIGKWNDQWKNMQWSMNTGSMNNKTVLDHARAGKMQALADLGLVSIDEKTGNITVNEDRILKDLHLRMDQLDHNVDTPLTDEERKLGKRISELSTQELRDRDGHKERLKKFKDRAKLSSKFWESKPGSILKALGGSAQSALDRINDSDLMIATKEHVNSQLSRAQRISEKQWNRFTETEKAKWLEQKMNEIDKAVTGDARDSHGNAFSTGNLHLPKFNVPSVDAQSGDVETHHTGGIVGDPSSRRKKIDLNTFTPPKYHSGGIIGHMPDLIIQVGQRAGIYYTNSPTGEKIEWRYQPQLGKKRLTLKDVSIAKKWVASQHAKKFKDHFKSAGSGMNLTPNEVPAILEKGEEVITRNDPRHRRNKGLRTIDKPDEQLNELKQVNANLVTLTELVMALNEKEFNGMLPISSLKRWRDKIRNGTGSAKDYLKGKWNDNRGKIGQTFDKGFEMLRQGRQWIGTKLGGIDYNGLRASAMMGYDYLRQTLSGIAQGAKTPLKFAKDKTQKLWEFLTKGDKPVFQKIKDAGSSMWSRVKEAGTDSWNMISPLFSGGIVGMKDRAHENYQKVKSTMASGHHRIKKFLSSAKDIVSNANHRTLITKDQLVRGGLYNAIDKSPVTCLADITGPVKNAEGKFLVTMSDWALGLHEANFNDRMVHAGVRARNKVDSVIKDTKANYHSALAKGKEIHSNLKDYLFGVKDIVNGSGRIVITRAQLKSGMLTNAVDGTPVHSLEDITGPVRDGSRKYVVTASDWGSGLRYATMGDRAINAGTNLRNKIAGGYSKAKNFVTSAKNQVISGARMVGRGAMHLDHAVRDFKGMPIKNMAGGIAKFLGKPFSAVFSFAKGFIKGNSVYNQNDIMRDNHAITDTVSGLQAVNMSINKLGMLTESQGRPEAKKFWQNADGSRKGDEKRSLMSKLLTTGKKDKDGKEVKSKLGSVFDLVKKFAGKAGIMAMAGIAAGAVTRWVFGDKATDAHPNAVHGVEGAAALATTKLGRKAEWWAAKNIGKAAWWGAKQLGKGALRVAGSTIVRGAAMAAIEGIGALAAGAASIISAPVLLGALAVGALVYGGYKLYKHFANKKSPLTRFRLAQYGVDLSDSKQAQAVLDLEAALLKDTTIAGPDGVAYVGSKYKPEDFYASFGIDKERNHQTKKWATWYLKRFKPIYISHVTSLYRKVNTKDIHKVDDLLGGKPAVDFLKHVHYTSKSHSPYFIKESPFGDDSHTTYDADDVFSAFTNTNKVVADLPDKGDKQQNAPKITDANAALKAKQDQASKDKTSQNQKDRDAKKSSLFDSAKNAYNGLVDKTSRAMEKGFKLADRAGSAVADGVIAAKEAYEKGGSVLDSARKGLGAAVAGFRGSGSGKVKADGMVNWLNNNAGSTSKGQCAKYVRLALEAGGADTSGHPLGAKDYGPTLIKNGFVTVPNAGYKPQKGDVCVFDAHGNSQYGHICVFSGTQWISDFKQNDMNPYSGRPNVPYAIYRPGSGGGGSLDKTVAPAGKQSVSQIAAQADLINAAKKWGITDPKEMMMLLAQSAHESGDYKFLHELGSGQQYEGRRDLGNTQPGDGSKFKGRAWLEVTGRSNYAAYGKATGQDTVNHPEILETPSGAADASLFWWMKLNGNRARKAAKAGDIVGTTKAVNGGTNGLEDRKAKYAQAQQKFGNAKSLDDMIAMVGSNGPNATAGKGAPNKPNPADTGAAKAGEHLDKGTSSAPAPTIAAPSKPSSNGASTGAPAKEIKTTPVADQSANTLAASQAAANARNQSSKSNDGEMLSVMKNQLKVQNQMAASLAKMSNTLDLIQKGAGTNQNQAQPAPATSSDSMPGMRTINHDASAPVPMGTISLS